MSISKNNPMNTEKLLKLASFIEKLNPDQVDMEGYVLQEIDGAWEEVTVDNEEQFHALLSEPCGTAGCIAGWTRFIWPPKDEVDEVTGRAIKVDTWKHASAVLGISVGTEAYRLFYTSGWPEDLKEKYFSRPNERNKIIAEVIRRFVACGGDWRKDQRE